MDVVRKVLNDSDRFENNVAYLKHSNDCRGEIKKNVAVM